VPQRSAEIVAEFLHPETDAPMVTWYQTSEFRDEKPEFYSASKKEFHGWFRSRGGDSE
jgi:hypothetical protein